MQARVVVGCLAICSGCVSGGRLTGGALAGNGGTTGFVTATFQFGMVDHELARLTLEGGETVSAHAPATHVGVRYDRAHDDRTAPTVSLAVEYGRDGGYAMATAGIAIQQPSLDDERPDVLHGHLWAFAIEGLAGIGGHTDDRGARIGAQLSLELLWFDLLR